MNMEEIDFRTDERFNIVNIASKLGIRITGPEGFKVRAKCPFCDDDNNKKGHLYLTVENQGYHNVYKCMRCGASGSAVQLYAKLKNVDTSTAVRELINDGIDRRSIKITKQIINKQKNVRNCEVKDVERLNIIYRDLLEMLTLSPFHKNNLLNRGMFYSTIKEKKYKTIPMDYNRRQDICQQLIKKHGKKALYGISGFYYNKKVSRWDFYAPKGMLIPISNSNGQIVAMQIRLDKPIKNVRYQCFSSAKYYLGTPCFPHVHVAYNEGKSKNKIVVTEGPIKADIGAQFLDSTFLALPGVGSLHGELLDILKQFKCNNIDIAFDMDILDKEPVQMALNRLKDRLDAEDIEYVQITWKEHYRKDQNIKGIDDYLSYEYNKKINSLFA